MASIVDCSLLLANTPMPVGAALLTAGPAPSTPRSCAACPIAVAIGSAETVIPALVASKAAAVDPVTAIATPPARPNAVPPKTAASPAENSIASLADGDA